MKKCVRKLNCKILVLIFVISILPGCWSVNEINDLAIITLMGIDKNEKGEIEISTLIVKPGGGLQGPGGGGAGEDSSLIVSAKGDSIHEAIKKLSAILSKKMYWAHLEAVIFGEKATKEDVVPSLDFLNRQTQFRRNIHILISKDKASNILRTKSQLEGSLGAELNGIIKYSEENSITIVNDISEFSSDLSSDTKDPITGEVKITSKENGLDVFTGGTTSPSVVLQGTGVFKRGKLVGWFDRNETRGFLWLLGKTKKGTYKLNCPNNEKGLLNVEILESTISINPKKRKSNIEMDIAISTIAELEEATCSNLNINPNSMKKINKLLEKRIRYQINLALKKGKENWQTDVFEFGDAIYKKYPNEWENLAPNWRESGLKNLHVNVQIRAVVERTGMIDDPLEVDEAR